MQDIIASQLRKIESYNCEGFDWDNVDALFHFLNVVEKDEEQDAKIQNIAQILHKELNRKS